MAVNFSPGLELIFISARSFNRLPDHIKEALLEASYQAMIYGYEGVEEAQNAVVGNGPQPGAGNAYEEAGVRLVTLTSEEREGFKRAAGVEHNEDTYQRVRRNMARIAGTDVYDELREYQQSVAGQPINPQRWWA